MKNKGFTLIELLVVIAIIGILAVFTLAFLAPARQKGRDSKRKEDLNAVAKAQELFYSDNNEYAPSTTHCTTADPTNATAANFTAFGANGLVSTYINTMPTEPLAGITFDYRGCDTAAADPQGYVLQAQMENTNDPQIVPASADIFRLCGGNYAGAGASACSS